MISVEREKKEKHIFLHDKNVNLPLHVVIILIGLFI